MDGYMQCTMTGGLIKGMVYRYCTRQGIKCKKIVVGSQIICGLYEDEDLKIRHYKTKGTYRFWGYPLEVDKSYSTVKLYGEDGELIAERTLSVQR